MWMAIGIGRCVALAVVAGSEERSAGVVLESDCEWAQGFSGGRMDGLNGLGFVGCCVGLVRAGWGGGVNGRRVELRRGKRTVVKAVASGMEVGKREDSEEADVVLAEREALGLLDWDRVSERVARMASTSFGGSVLRAGMPLAGSIEDARRLLQETREVMRMTAEAQGLDFSGAGDIYDVVQIASRGGCVTGKELAMIADTLLAMRRNKRIVEGFSDGGEDELEALKALVASVSTKAELEQNIRSRVDSEGMVRDSASKELGDIRNEIRALSTSITAELNQLMSLKADALQDRIMTKRYNRFVLAVKASHKSRIPGTVHDSSSTGQTLYIEPRQVQNSNDKLRVLAKKEQAIVEKILRQLSEEVGESAEDLDRILQSLTHLDLANARARHSLRLGGVEPDFLHDSDENDAYTLELRSARHPLLLWQQLDTKQKLQSESKQKTAALVEAEVDEVVASDYIFLPGTRCAIVTGPNTGGKTVCLKNLGTAVLMARAGLFVCAEKASLPFFDRVLADIGDDQSIVQSLSTFSGHVERLKRVLDRATPNSLVLLDEVGSGTDPAEGAALGMALLRRLASTVKLTMATTHHGELKTLKYSDSMGRFENASVQFDDEKMRPTYRLIWGIPGRSNALAIARRLGLDALIVDDATEMLSGTSDADANEVIAALERQRLEVEKVNDRLRAKEKEVDFTSAKLRQRTEEIERDAAAAKEKLQQNVRAELDAAREEVRQVVRNMQKTGGSAKPAADARDQLDRLADRFKDNEERAKKQKKLQPEEVKEGDFVRVARLGDDLVRVVEAPSARGDVFVMCGQIKIKVKVTELEVSTGAEHGSKGSLTVTAGGKISVNRNTNNTSHMPQRVGEGAKSKFTGKSSRIVIKTPSNTVDIRGKRVEEALDRVREAINSSFDFGTMWIIHGHGTGALKAAVRESLRKSKLVAKYTDADRLDGGSGATVVHFK